MCESAFASTMSPLTLEPPPLSFFSRLGSRRRRLWELSRESHCPVIGVCLPLSVLRKLVGKVLDRAAPLEDYDCTSVPSMLAAAVTGSPSCCKTNSIAATPP